MFSKFSVFSYITCVAQYFKINNLCLHKTVVRKLTEGPIICPNAKTAVRDSILTKSVAFKDSKVYLCAMGCAAGFPP